MLKEPQVREEYQDECWDESPLGTSRPCLMGLVKDRFVGFATL